MLENELTLENNKCTSDRIGETVDITICPSCTYHEDCFANVSGRCTALIAAFIPCPFYKSAVVNRAEIQRSITRRKRIGRYDLILKYASTLAMLGALDEEIENMERTGIWLDEFQKSNLARLMRQVTTDDLSVFDDSDEEDEDEHEV